jgi:TonB family protein
MRKAILTSIIALLAAVPLIVPAAAQACGNPNADARAESTVYVPGIPGALGMSGTSVVKVSLNEKGDLISTSIFSSSGNRFLDDAALESARIARFAPEIRNCRAIAGTYLYEVEF